MSKTFSLIARQIVSYACVNNVLPTIGTEIRRNKKINIYSMRQNSYLLLSLKLSRPPDTTAANELGL